MNENVEFKKYSDRVLVNESTIEHSLYDMERLNRAAKLVTISNEILNQIKREIFYKKTDTKKYDMLNQNLKIALEDTQPVNEKPLESVFNMRVLHSLLGLNTESAELLEWIPKLINGNALDGVNIGEELGDILWYQAVLVDALKLDLNVTMEKNALKLEKRFKKGFDFNQAVNRDLDAERNILEKKD